MKLGLNIGYAARKLSLPLELIGKVIARVPVKKHIARYESAIKARPERTTKVK